MANPIQGWDQSLLDSLPEDVYQRLIPVDPNWQANKIKFNGLYPTGQYEGGMTSSGGLNFLNPAWREANKDPFGNFQTLLQGSFSPDDRLKEAIFQSEQAAKAEADYQNSGLIGKVGSLAFGTIGTLVGGPMLGGALAGAVGGLSSSPNAGFSDALVGAGKGAAAGGAMGYIGGEVGKGLSSMSSGYNPAVADSIWSSTASIPSWLSTAGQYASGPLMNMAKKGITNQIGGSIFGGNTPRDSTPRSNTQLAFNGAGGNMAIGDMTLGNLAGGIAPFLEGYQGYRGLQRGNEAYDKALDLIQTPSPDQARYRGMLSDLMTSPGKFYESPVYQNLAEQGRGALERSQSARGILGSGGAAAELQDLGMKQAAQYYFPLTQMVGGLSGISGDQAARALGAEGLINADISRNAREAGTLQSLMRGIGYEDPQTSMAKQLLGIGGGQGGIGGMTLSDIGRAAKDWFSPLYGSGDYGSYVNDPSIDYTGEFGPLIGGDGYSDWSSGKFGEGDWGYGTDTSWNDWF